MCCACSSRVADSTAAISTRFRGRCGAREGEAHAGFLAGGVECIHERLLGGNRRIVRAYRVAAVDLSGTVCDSSAIG